jgi:hypothetical protein
MEHPATERINNILAELHLANEMMAELFGINEEGK